MKFKLSIEGKNLIFNSELHGLKVGNTEYLSEDDEELIYDKTKNILSSEVELQLSSNTSTLIPALRVLEVPYNLYFDRRDVVGSQNNITFYWKPSKLAAFYNLYSTDQLPYDKRKEVVRSAVNFLIKNNSKLELGEEYLKKALEPCKLLGFYDGFPIFDTNYGFAKLQSRLGIHIGNENIMISTPMDKYSEDIYQLAEKMSVYLKESYSKKKNRVVFEKSEKLMKLLLPQNIK